MGEVVAPNWNDVHGLRSTDIAKRAANLRETLASIKVLQEEAENDKREIELLLTAAKTESVKVDDMRVTLAKGRLTRKLDTDKLMKLGVSLSTITAATVETTGKPYVRIFTKDESDGE